MYFDINKLMSYDCLFNLCLGSRGCGKTFSFKDYSIRDFLKGGWQFVYVRRFSTEFDEISTFFADISKQYPEHEFSVNGNKFYIDGKVAGFGIPLTIAQQYKSMPFPMVNKMLFDEFIIDSPNHHYLKNEINIFFDLCETIFRDREFRCFLFANSVTLINPYCINFHFTQLPYNNNVIRNKETDSIIMYANNEEYIKHRKSTRFGKAISGTKYSEYAIENKVRDMNKNDILPKTDCVYFCTLCTKEQDLYFYMKNDYTMLWCSSNNPHVNARRYAITIDGQKENTLVTRNVNKNYHLSCIKKAVSMGILRYDDMQSKVFFQRMINLFV